MKRLLPKLTGRCASERHRSYIVVNDLDWRTYWNAAGYEPSAGRYLWEWPSFESHLVHRHAPSWMQPASKDWLMQEHREAWPSSPNSGQLSRAFPLAELRMGRAESASSFSLGWGSLEHPLINVSHSHLRVWFLGIPAWNNHKNITYIYILS